MTWPQENAIQLNTYESKLAYNWCLINKYKDKGHVNKFSKKSFIIRRIRGIGRMHSFITKHTCNKGHLQLLEAISADIFSIIIIVMVITSSCDRSTVLRCMKNSWWVWKKRKLWVAWWTSHRSAFSATTSTQRSSWASLKTSLTEETGRITLTMYIGCVGNSDTR